MINMKRITHRPFFDYFENYKEYPQSPYNTHPGTKNLKLPPNTLFSYVSSDFLDRLIPSVTLLDAFIINRYLSPEEWEKAKEQISTLSRDSITWDVCPDDCLALGETEHEFWFFWYDMDSSDCAIGRFSKELERSLRVVVDSFIQMVAHHEYRKGKEVIRTR